MGATCAAVASYTILTRARVRCGQRNAQVVKIAGQTKLPVVRFASGDELLIRRETWSLRRGDTTVACRSQIPLDLGWAISVHKSQGMSLDAVEMDLSSVFECGQAYVALSRAKSLSGLKLTRPLQRRAIRAHPDVIAFYNSLQL